MPYNPSKQEQQLSAVIQAMRDGAAIITPNNRLAEQLLARYITEDGRRTLEKPICLPYQAFLQHVFERFCHQHPHDTHPVLLNDAQLRTVWRHVLTPDENSQHHQKLLNSVLSAWTVCNDWQISLPHPDFELTEQTQQFEIWRARGEARLKHLHAIARQQLVSYLINHIKNPPFRCLHWVCFDDYTPLQQAFQAHLSALGVEQHHDDFIEESTDESIPTTYQCIARDKQDEYARMLHFVREKLKSNATHIGLVIPDLNQDASNLMRYFKRHLPEDVFNISLGKPLTEYPFVAHALQWISLNQIELSQHQAQLLLSSPHLVAAQSEFLARASCFNQLPILQEQRIPFSHFKHAIQAQAPALAEALQALTSYPTTETPLAWARLFYQRLTQLGFPGEAGLTSAQYQCFQRFIALMDDFVALSVVTPTMCAKEAFRALHDLAKNTIFQPEKSDAPVQILGLLEASGCAYDAVWMSGATDQTLPTRTRLSAFIPIALQRERDMPYANASREQRLAEKRITRLQLASQEQVFSYPALMGDIPALPSPLILSYPELPEARAPKPITHITKLLTEPEPYTYPFTEHDTRTGGTARLTDQALCPFRAFAAHRLKATSAPEPTEGPDAMLRGQVIHHILELIWKKLKTQRALIACRQADLEKDIDTAIHTALAPIRANKPTSFPLLMQTVEHARLKRLVYACLTWDQSRPAFDIEAIEQSYHLTLGELEFRVRVDRIDRLHTGEKWVLDYKSRLPSPLPWHEERPESPQLLLYALLDDAIRGLLFVELKNGQTACRGLTENENTADIQGIKTIKSDESWSTYQHAWHQRLITLAHEYQTGHSVPRPPKKSTCQTCDFKPLCRISS
ncbi:MAG: PD-(D/E)XK nuclease family protein [Legionellaceae bacterium]|nr:PD-(D/E)XK nuclease family protein [Legionellaceae bacterium]